MARKEIKMRCCACGKLGPASEVFPWPSHKKDCKLKAEWMRRSKDPTVLKKEVSVFITALYGTIPNAFYIDCVIERIKRETNCKD
jgi:hypothetical protein